MRALVTGGGGFIGSHVLARMVGAGIDVTLLGPDAGQSRYVHSLVRAGEVRLLTCDTRFGDEEVLRVALEDADAIVLLGYALPGGGSPAERLLGEFMLNVDPLVRLIRAAADRPRHLVFSSSVAVYGRPQRVPVSEGDITCPNTPYAVAKLAAELAIRVSAAATGCTASILRYATVYGPGETGWRKIPRLIRSGLVGEPPILDGEGLDQEDYVHVADVADATLRALHRRADGVFNIGTGIATSTIDIARRVITLTGGRVAPIARGPANGEAPAVFRCDTALAEKALGFVARRSLADGLGEEVGWIKSQLRTPALEVLAATA